MTVQEALEQLHSAIDKEVISHATSCGVISDSEYVCTRCAGHSGAHIATGLENVYEIWYDESP